MKNFLEEVSWRGTLSLYGMVLSRSGKGVSLPATARQNGNVILPYITKHQFAWKDAKINDKWFH